MSKGKRPGQKSASAANYPRPDRSDFMPNRVKSDENAAVDLGWAEGVFADGRPWRMECWAEEQLTCLTVFCSSIGLEPASDSGFPELLEAEGLVRYLLPEQYYSAPAKRFTDASGNSMWSINVVVGDDESVFAETLPLRPYST